MQLAMIGWGRMGGNMVQRLARCPSPCSQTPVRLGLILYSET